MKEVNLLAEQKIIDRDKYCAIKKIGRGEAQAFLMGCWRRTATPLTCERQKKTWEYRASTNKGYLFMSENIYINPLDRTERATDIITITAIIGRKSCVQDSGLSAGICLE